MASDKTRMEDQYAIELRDILDIYGVAAKKIEGSIISSVVLGKDAAAEIYSRGVTLEEYLGES